MHFRSCPELMLPSSAARGESTSRTTDPGMGASSTTTDSARTSRRARRMSSTPTMSFGRWSNSSILEFLINSDINTVMKTHTQYLLLLLVKRAYTKYTDPLNIAYLHSKWCQYWRTLIYAVHAVVYGVQVRCPGQGRRERGGEVHHRHRQDHQRQGPGGVQPAQHREVGCKHPEIGGLKYDRLGWTRPGKILRLWQNKCQLWRTNWSQNKERLVTWGKELGLNILGASSKIFLFSGKCSKIQRKLRISWEKTSIL